MNAAATCCNRVNIQLRHRPPREQVHQFRFGVGIGLRITKLGREHGSTGYIEVDIACKVLVGEARAGLLGASIATTRKGLLSASVAARKISRWRLVTA